MSISLLNRSLFKLSGEGVQAWLEGIVTNTLSDDLTFTALLTPQGKIIADFFVTKDGADFLIDTPTKFSDALFKRLKMYRLRAPITIEDVTELFQVYALWDETERLGHPDPRHPSLGHRFITPTPLTETDSDYNAHRLSLGIVDSEWDFETQTTFPADANMDLMNGVNFQKGCFVGQEVVSRMKRMTTVKKRMRGVIFTGQAQAGDRIMADSRVIGEILYVQDKMGIALVRLDRWRAAEASPTVNDVEIAIMDSIDGQKH
ncbi:hypothetical protein DES40_0051 [Litorimonas taeanensis]|uniref:CAF17 C-terminal domain-containing protein n=1 Tax=Litorimonas taeanensis TaxID=568099 RepID=A0A420WII6_9PROT|nr:folate-binding protein YgfZ [Litorimonas taeanensis]RKQ70752.1 hypothetical protein DES40_0051 [Litorimonas taeanensis]